MDDLEDVKLKDGNGVVKVAEDKVKCNKVELKQKLKEIVNSGRAIALKMPWTNYLKEFKIATRANEWSEKGQAINLTIAHRGE